MVNLHPYSKTISALSSLGCQRRVLLSGTPVQNDLDEFFAVLDFACPGVLGDLSGFRRIFAVRLGPYNNSMWLHDHIIMSIICGKLHQ